MNEDFKVLLKVEVDPSSLSSIDDKIKNAINEKVKIKADLSNLKEVESELDEIANKIRSVNRLKVDINGSVNTKVSNVNSKATNNSSTIKTETKQVNELTAAYRELKSLMTQASKYELKRLGLDKDSQEAKILNQQLGEIDKRISDINKKYKSSFSESQNKSLGKIEEDANNAVELKQAKLADKYAKQAEQAKRVADAYKGIDRVELSNRIQTWMNRNSAAAKDYFKDLQRIQQELKECDDAKLGNLAQQFKRITTEASAQGKTGLTFFDRFKSKMAELTTYFSAIDVMQGASRVVRDMAQNVLEVDTAMTELYRVTDLTKSQYDDLYDTMTADAKKYGTQLDVLINSTASWTRLGFDANTAEQLAGVSAMYQHVTDLDEQTAVENLVTGYKAYQNQLLELTNNDSAKAVERVADIYDNLGNQLPVSAAQVGEGMTKWASVAEMAGASIEEASALLVGGGAVTQDFDRMGNALRTSALRIRGMKGALEELGEEVDDNVESVSKMQTHLLNLTKGKVNIFEADNKSFRNIYEVYRDIAGVWDDLSDTDQADLLETIAGKTRANDVKAVISNWAEVEKAASVAANSEGTAREEQEKYMNSLEGKLAALQATWQNLSNTFLSSDLLRNLLESATSLLDVVNGIVDKVGVLPTLITLISGGLSAFKNVGRCKMFHLDKVCQQSYVFYTIV